MNNISTILKYLMGKAGISEQELSRKTSLNQSVINRLLSGENKNPTLASLKAISSYFLITISQLVGEEPIGKETGDVFKPSKIEKKCAIPLLDSVAVLKYLESKIVSNIPFVDIDLPLSNKAFAYFMQGNAMEPQFPDKTLLIIDPELTVENLDHVLVLPQGKKTPLFRQILLDGEEQYLRTLNPSFNEFIKIIDNNYKIIGIMVQARRSFKDLTLQLKPNKSRGKKFQTIE